MPPDVIYDYTKCKGSGECVDVCPVTILELSPDGKWCKAIDQYVTNKEAVEAYHSQVEKSKDPVPIKIHNEMPDCIACMACVTACPEQALEVLAEFPSGQKAVEQIT